MVPRLLFASLAAMSLGVTPVWAGEQAEAEAPADLTAWLDQRFVALWSQEGRTPPAPIDDATFMRRIYLDLVGTIPSVPETRDFLNDPDPLKREKLIEKLLHDRRYAEHMARIWRRVLVPQETPGYAFAMQMEPWLIEQFAGNVGYDDFARRILTAKPPAQPQNLQPQPGAAPQRPEPSPIAFYQAVGQAPPEVAGAVTQVFLGVRLHCARCHDHPFAEWKQEDFWGMAAFFAGTSFSGNPLGGQPQFAEERKVEIAAENGQTYPVKFLSGEKASVPEGKLPREVLAEWLTSDENVDFAATGVNRVWQHLCGRGLTDSVDDLDLASPEERALVLDDLARKFIASDFDMLGLTRAICRSRFYQSASATAEELAQAGPAFRRPLKTLTPEQVFDSLEQALTLPITRGDKSPRYNGERSQMVARLSEAVANSPDQYRAGIPQVLMMMNGRLTADATSLDGSRTLRAVVEAPFLPAEEKIETLYLATFTRKPRDHELSLFLQHIRSQSTEEQRREAYGEIFWALLNSPEFVLCR